MYDGVNHIFESIDCQVDKLLKNPKKQSFIEYSCYISLFQKIVHRDIE